MYINFRQGIITYPTSGTQQSFLAPAGAYVHLYTTNGRVDVAAAHGTDDYVITESTDVQNAWGPLPAATDCWLYWDIDKRTAVRTFGFTLIAPAYGPVQPTSPVPNMHWFDTVNGIMYSYISGQFREVIRVFAAKVNNNTFTPMGYGFNNKPYAGTQVGLSQTSVRAGNILIDNLGNPVRRSNGHFLTTEHEFFVDGSPVNVLRLESAILTGTAQTENLHAYQIVKFSNFGQIEHATYNDLQTTVIAMLLEDTSRYDAGTVCIQGHITNASWDWTVVGAPLWVDDTGALTETNPHTSSPLIYPTNKSPVARVVTQNSIVFNPSINM